MKRLMFAVAVVIGLVFAGAGPAYAHNSLVEAIPAKDATPADPPAEVKLRFLATLNTQTKLTVTAADGSSAIGAVTVDGKFISAPFIATAGGVYTVGYELVSEDGHPVKNTYTFTLQDKVEPVKVTESAAPAATTAAAAPEKKDESTPWLPWIGGAAVAGLLVGGLLTFLRNRRERT